MKRVLITGAAGFIGFHLSKRLTTGDTKYDVHCLVRKTSRIDRLQPFGATLHYTDLTDARALEAAIRAVDSPDIVFHLAGCVRAPSPEKFLAVNKGGLENLVNACLKTCKTPPLIVFVSSLAAVGPSRDGTLKTERDIPEPISPYGKSKLAAEQFLASVARQIPSTVVRPGIVFGEADTMNLELFRTIQKLGICPIPGWRDKKHSWIHAEDLAQVLLSAAESGERMQTESLESSNCGKGIYFAAAKEKLPLSELGRIAGHTLGRQKTTAFRCPPVAVLAVSSFYEMRKRMTGKDQPFDWDKAYEARYNWLCSSQKAAEQLGFQPATSFEQRMKQTIHWYRENGELA